MAARRRRRNTPADQKVVPDELREQLAAAGAPPELLDALEGLTDLDEAIPRLIAAGLLPTPEQALESLLECWGPLLRRGTGPLDAELAGVEFLAALRATGAEEADLPDVLRAMVANAEGSASPEALAMCRTLAVVGPTTIRPVAAAAAQRLVTSGLTDRPWAAAMGRPKIGGCFGYQDLFGQEVIAVVFSYGRKSHAIPVLIDHGLGGGIKDCYVAEGPHRIRAAYEHSASRGGTDVEDYSPTEALTILDRAVAADPCPVEPDQIEDVDTYLPLLRERMELLRAPAPSATAVRRRRRAVHRLKITLRGSKPPIWRRIEVASGTDLGHLHEIIQATFGWYGYHMWVFTTADGEYGEPDPELGHEDAGRHRLSAVAPHQGDRIRYTYDFGDDWEHEILVEEVAAAEPDATYPRCLTGRRARPPEDCGGMWGYRDLLEVLADPDHPDHAERLEWLGLASPDELDPAHFDLAEVNSSLAGKVKPH